MIKKIVFTAAVAAFAVSFAPSASFAKKMHKHKHHAMHKCMTGHMMTGKANSMGWAPVMGCGADGKMYTMPAMCYAASGMCPKG